MIRQEHLYLLVGAMFAGFAVSHGLERRWRSAGFWGLYALLLTGASGLPDLVNGFITVAMVGLAVIGLRAGALATTTPAERAASALRLGNGLFVPAFIIPALTIAMTLAMRDGTIAGVAVMPAKQVTLIALGIGAVIAFVAAVLLTDAPAGTWAGEGRRLADSVGWAMFLPQLLASLGAIFAFAGVGEHVTPIITRIVSLDTVWSATIVYCVGMALFTIMMGNAFAAFPIMTAAVGLPVLIRHFGGDPAAVCAIGMLSGFCGTLVTPMAANYNAVPAAILELSDRNRVIRMQAPTALALFFANIVLMLILAF